ncbi:aldehyde dehydrogenase family protein, partial [Acinetobacter baumannii]|uniref:aldehyde dehydrogenase family protein n=1 Tax=Acinetobacter baumannii TaxID=470 RepID=UPI003396DC06
GHVNSRTMTSIAYGKLSNGGQTCVPPDYAHVHEDSLEIFMEEYNATVSRFYPNGPDCDDYTSIVNELHYARLQGLLDSARQNGARIIEVGVNSESAKNRTRTLVPT